MFGADEDAEQTVKVPGPVNTCVLKLPEVTIVPPVATIKFSPTKPVPSSTDNQPFVASA